MKNLDKGTEYTGKPQINAPLQTRVTSKMEDVADVNIARIRENLSNWEDDSSPLAPLTPRERDSIIEVTSGSEWRPLPQGEEGEEGEKGGGEARQGTPDQTKHRLHDSLAALKLGEVKIESSQQVSYGVVCLSVCVFFVCFDSWLSSPVRCLRVWVV